MAEKAKKKRKKRITALPVLIALALVLLIFIMVYEGVTARKAAELAAIEATATTPPTETTAETMPVFTSQREWAEYMVKQFAEEHGIHHTAYPLTVIEMLERDPDTEDYVKDYPIEFGNSYPANLTDEEVGTGVPLFLQWDKRWGYMIYGADAAGLTGSGPVCLSMAAVYLTGDKAMSPDYMIQFSIDNGYVTAQSGTAWLLISEGAGKLGMEATELYRSETKILEYLGAGDVIICMVGEGHFTDSGQYIVLAGCQGDMIQVHDPNSRTNSQRLWDFDEFSDEIKNIWLIRKP